MKANRYAAVFAATTMLFTAAQADPGPDGPQVYGEACWVNGNPHHLSAQCNHDLDPNKNRPPLISPAQAQAIVDAVKAKRAAAQAKAAQDAIAANNCGTNQVRVGGCVRI